MNLEFFNELKDRLYVKPGFHYAKQYLKTAVLVPLIKSPDGISLLFEKRAEGISQANEICFPGGIMENSDLSPQDTALRESFEELGLKADKIQILGNMNMLFTLMGLSVSPVVAQVFISDLKELKPDPVEVAEVFCLPLRWFKENKPEKYSIQIMAHPEITNEKGEREVLLPAEELGLGKAYTKAWGRLRYPVFFWPSSKGMIWGITAEIIKTLLEITEDLKL